MKYNYHTHTTRCMHASGSDEEYVLAAIEAGYDVLGFSDHTPWHYDSDFVAYMRMKESQFDDYYQSISKLKRKYHDQIDIKIGLEVEYFKKYLPWLKQLLTKYELDYIILGNHYMTSDELRIYYGSACRDNQYLEKYVDDIIEAMHTGLYTYVAHPDLFMRGRNKFDDFAYKQSLRLCTAAKELNIPLEYNLEGAKVLRDYGIKGYPCDEFWDIVAKVQNEVVIGIDAHEPDSLKDEDLYQGAIENLAKKGIKSLPEVKLINFKEK